MICQYLGCQTLFFTESPFSVISLTCLRAEPFCNGQDNVDSQVLCILEHTQKIYHLFCIPPMIAGGMDCLHSTHFKLPGRLQVSSIQAQRHEELFKV